MYGAMLDDTGWPATSALIDEACGLTGNDLLVGEGLEDDVRVLFVGAYCRGQRREDRERDYLENYHSTDERVPRFRQLPDSRLVHVRNLLTAEELKTSPTCNEMLRRTGGQTAGLAGAAASAEPCRRSRHPQGADGRAAARRLESLTGTRTCWYPARSRE